MLELMKGFEGPRGARPLWLVERAKGTGMGCNVGWENKQHVMTLNGSLVTQHSNPHYTTRRGHPSLSPENT